MAFRTGRDRADWSAGISSGVADLVYCSAPILSAAHICVKLRAKVPTRYGAGVLRARGPIGPRKDGPRRKDFDSGGSVIHAEPTHLPQGAVYSPEAGISEGIPERISGFRSGERARLSLRAVVWDVSEMAFSLPRLYPCWGWPINGLFLRCLFPTDEAQPWESTLF